MSENEVLKQENSSEKRKSAEELKREMRKNYAEFAKNSLVRVQYSCSGNSSDIDLDDFDLENREV